MKSPASKGQDPMRPKTVNELLTEYGENAGFFVLLVFIGVAVLFLAQTLLVIVLPLSDFDRFLVWVNGPLTFFVSTALVLMHNRSVDQDQRVGAFTLFRLLRDRRNYDFPEYFEIPLPVKFIPDLGRVIKTYDYSDYESEYETQARPNSSVSKLFQNLCSSYNIRSNKGVEDVCTAWTRYDPGWFGDFLSNNDGLPPLMQVIHLQTPRTALTNRAQTLHGPGVSTVSVIPYPGDVPPLPGLIRRNKKNNQLYRVVYFDGVHDRVGLKRVDNGEATRVYTIARAKQEFVAREEEMERSLLERAEYLSELPVFSPSREVLRENGIGDQAEAVAYRIAGVLVTMFAETFWPLLTKRPIAYNTVTNVTTARFFKLPYAQDPKIAYIIGIPRSE